MTYTIKAKIKQTKTFGAWFAETSRLAACLYNSCLEMQFERAARGDKLFSTIDMINLHRSFPLGSDFKDRTIERAVKATSAWYSSDLLRYEIYWKNLEKHVKNPQVTRDFSATDMPHLLAAENNVARQNDFRSFVKNLARKQKIIGKPRRQKAISLAFAIRKNRQDTVKFTGKTVEVTVPKYAGSVRGRHNRLPFASNFSFAQGILKKDKCGDMWLCLVVEGDRPRLKFKSEPRSEKRIVGIDLGLKSARTVVAVDEASKAIVEIYQPDRTNFFNLGYNALVKAANRDRRSLPFIHRKIARRRHDCVEKDVCKTISMGDEFKIGKPSTAWLLSGRLARSAADAANSMYLTRLAKRAKEAGKESGEVNESDTSQTCRKCGSKKKMPLSCRIYECEKGGCGHVEDRDVNAAYQIAFRDFAEKKTKAPRKLTNGVLPRRGMKGISQDSQAQPPCKPRDLSRGGAMQV